VGIYLFFLGQVPTLGPLAQSAVIYLFFPWTSPSRVFNLPDFGPFGTECGNLDVLNNIFRQIKNRQIKNKQIKNR
jgi:hypothetical protein